MKPHDIVSPVASFEYASDDVIQITAKCYVIKFKIRCVSTLNGGRFTGLAP